ncbi:PepSY domain-containing protein [Halorussus sp. AFM4]|uniref:PepSY domain-containing protein n=1 Tax=Halorussus sp. AFM4 TaxID=3421651 RepID=UPI003EB80E78
MKRNQVLVVGIVVLLGAVGIGFAATGGQLGATDPDLSKQEAKTIAADHVGGTAQNVALEQENGPVYEVTVEQDNGALKEVEVDGNSGDVLEVENADDGEEGADDSDGEDTA